MRMAVLVFIAACASHTDDRLEARPHGLEQQIAELRADVKASTAMQQCKTMHSTSVPEATTFDAAVPFAIGESHLRDSDRIVIHELRGTRDHVEVDGAYVVRGEYTLASADEASLGFTVRTTESGQCTDGMNSRGHLVVKRGSGSFELAMLIPYSGDASLSFFRRHDRGITTRDDELSTIYFAKIPKTNITDVARKAETLTRE